MNDTQLFAFENDFVATLRCVPMAVRFKLDQCGVKLSLRQWSRFTRADRQALLMAPCHAPREVEAYRATLVSLIQLRAGEAAKPLMETPCGQWNNAEAVPLRIIAHAQTIGVAPPDLAAWQSLSVLQRFTLLKLTRDSHDNLNFTPAMIEFGLAEPQPSARRMRRLAAAE